MFLWHNRHIISRSKNTLISTRQVYQKEMKYSVPILSTIWSTHTCTHTCDQGSTTCFFIPLYLQLKVLTDCRTGPRSYCTEPLQMTLYLYSEWDFKYSKHLHYHHKASQNFCHHLCLPSNYWQSIIMPHKSYALLVSSQLPSNAWLSQVA